MGYLAYFDIPEDINRKDIRGSSPYLLDVLMGQLKEATEIKISLFLYNNPFLHHFLEEKSKNGCRIEIFTIPLNGYTKQLVKVFRGAQNKAELHSKHEYASKIYDRVKVRLYPNIELKIFPHTYVWKKQLFSRGKEAYSFHVKAVMARMANGSTKCISLSSNLAFADQSHSDNLIVNIDDPNTIYIYNEFFNLLSQNSLSLEQYELYSKDHFDFEYTVSPIDIKIDYEPNCLFSAPFIKYNGSGSNHYVQNKIINLIKSAKNRVYICSQHFMDINSFDSNAKSILHALGETFILNPKLEIKVLKQTRAENQAQGDRTHQSEAYIKKIQNTEQRYNSPLVHDKFIIVDEKVIVMTANITPTQFAWDYPRNMKYEVEGVPYDILNCFSEVNCFHFIDDKVITEKYTEHFWALWDKSKAIY